ncbi:hypothetical protein [Actinophytocola sp.]|uniref:hypothetical protein n=1 Tax=Actinophytocola sp. TaxID=1872138 RepID=UPI002ED8994F
MNAQLMAMFTAWRQEIDSVPFAYEAELDTMIFSLPDDHCWASLAARRDDRP